MKNYCHPIKLTAQYSVQEQMITLKQIPRHTGFKIPEGYLDNFKVNLKIDSSSFSFKKPSNRIPIWAAAACIFLLLGYFIAMPNENLSQEEIAIYLLEETDVDVLELVDSFGTELFMDQYDVSSQSIENYLIEDTNFFDEFTTTQ